MAATTSGLKGVRLILADESIGGGQRMMTFDKKPLTVAEVLSMLSEHLGLKEACKQRGLDPSTLSAESGLAMMGFDGPRRMPVRGDAGLVSFLASIEYTNLPSLEVKLARKAPPPAPAASRDAGDRKGAAGREARDQVEKLEDANFALQRTNEKLVRRLDELERVQKANREESLREITLARKDLTASQEKMGLEIEDKLGELRRKDASILDDLDVVRQHSFAVERKDLEGQEELKGVIAQLTERMDKQFQAVEDELERQRIADEELRQEDLRESQELEKHQAELERLEEVKVNMALWKEHEESMDERITQEVEELCRKLATAQAELTEHINQVSDTQQRDHKSICKTVEQLREEHGNELQRIEEKFDTGLAEAAKSLTKVRIEVLAHTDVKVKALSDTTEASFVAMRQEVTKKDIAVNKRVDELTAKSETTFKGVHERLEEMVRVERARFGTVERDLVEITTRIRADCRFEIDRVRSDYEKEAARLDADLGDLHMKHDVTKQEINFVQSKLIEQREWAQRQLTETAIATRAVQVDAQEGLAATTKMLHALRDDAVGFREKMGKYISLLQHSSDSQGDAISALETQRGRIRCDLDMLIEDHKAYTVDMDGWADDVRVKVERLFRALEPSRVEWRVQRASKRAKELKKPLAVRSPTFSLRGLREVVMEFYPEGTNTSPEGKAILRLFLPPGTHVKYQCWVGFHSEGSREHRPQGSLTADIPIEDWKSQIQEDGSLPVRMEVLRDFAGEDETLSPEVRIESP